MLIVHTCAKRLVYKHRLQRAKKVVSDSPGLVDFAIGQVNIVLNLPDGQVKFFEKFKIQKKCEINSAHQNVFGASSNDVWASKCYLQLARMASCKTDFLCTLLCLLQLYLMYSTRSKVTSHRVAYLWHFSMPSVNCFDYVIALFTSSYCWHKPVVSCNQGSARRPQYYNWGRIWLE